MDNGYRKLADAIIELAARDYKRAVKRLKKRPHDSKAREIKMSVFRFFRSDCFCQLTDLDGEDLIEKLDKEAE